jgi:hypothetical protein
MADTYATLIAAWERARASSGIAADTQPTAPAVPRE